MTDLERPVERTGDAVVRDDPRGSDDRSSDCEVMCLDKCAGICGVSDFDGGCRFDIVCWLNPEGTIDSPSCKRINEIDPIKEKES